MQRREFEVSMLLRTKITDATALENAKVETHSLLLVVAALHSAAALSQDNMATIIQSCGSGEVTNHIDEKDADLSMGMARLRQHLRIKIADSEDLICAHTALLELSAFFRALVLMKNHMESPSDSYDLLIRLRDWP